MTSHLVSYLGASNTHTYAHAHAGRYAHCFRAAFAASAAPGAPQPERSSLLYCYGVLGVVYEGEMEEKVYVMKATGVS